MYLPFLTLGVYFLLLGWAHNRAKISAKLGVGSSSGVEPEVSASLRVLCGDSSLVLSLEVEAGITMSGSQKH